MDWIERKIKRMLLDKPGMKRLDVVRSFSEEHRHDAMVKLGQMFLREEVETELPKGSKSLEDTLYYWGGDIRHKVRDLRKYLGRVAQQQSPSPEPGEENVNPEDPLLPAT